MTIESIIGIVSGVITIALAVPVVYNYYKKQSLDGLMNSLVNKDLTTSQHQKILRKMNRKLVGACIKDDYIQHFVLDSRGKEAVFKDICEKNDIEPTREICLKFLKADMPKYRASYNRERKTAIVSEEEATTEPTKPSRSINADNYSQTVYISELLITKHLKASKELISILGRHNVKYGFIKGTNDIWCRDYMPVKTESGKLIQFKYDPSYLRGSSELEALRSDVEAVRKVNGISAQTSDINLDGGNVLICDGRAIISDRIFDENPDRDKEQLVNELSQLLECEIIIIPAIHEDFTGHADGMVRFVDRNTILGNRMADEYKYWQKGMKKVLDTYNLTYIDVPFFEDKDPKNKDSAVGVYVNFLEVNDLIVAPIFGNNMDNEVIEILQKTFPNKQIETIDYNEVAKEGGLLNCTTWVV